MSLLLRPGPDGPRRDPVPWTASSVLRPIAIALNGLISLGCRAPVAIVIAIVALQQIPEAVHRRSATEPTSRASAVLRSGQDRILSLAWSSDGTALAAVD